MATVTTQERPTPESQKIAAHTVDAFKIYGKGHVSIPVTSLVAVVVLAAIAGVGAAVLPGRRAANLDVLKAVVTEWSPNVADASAPFLSEANASKMVA